MVDAVERCPLSLPASPSLVGQIIAGQCPVIVCPALQSCPSPFRPSPLYIGRRAAPDGWADADASLRPPGPRRLLHPGEAAPSPDRRAGVDPDAADAADAGLVQGMGPAGARPAQRAAAAAAGNAGRRGGRRGGAGAEWGEERVRVRGPEMGGGGRRAFGEEGYYVELRVVGYKSSLVDAAAAMLLCRNRRSPPPLLPPPPSPSLPPCAAYVSRSHPPGGGGAAPWRSGRAAGLG